MTVFGPSHLPAGRLADHTGLSQDPECPLSAEGPSPGDAGHLGRESGQAEERSGVALERSCRETALAGRLGKNNAMKTPILFCKDPTMKAGKPSLP
jgi:hypothetical protein